MAETTGAGVEGEDQGGGQATAFGGKFDPALRCPFCGALLRCILRPEPGVGFIEYCHDFSGCRYLRRWGVRG